MKSTPEDCVIRSCDAPAQLYVLTIKWGKASMTLRQVECSNRHRITTATFQRGSKVAQFDPSQPWPDLPELPLWKRVQLENAIRLFEAGKF
ncbi:MAG: hypothetical protein NVSMB39_4620 [Candidatus Saccharimonadales bacterium]